MSQEELEEKQRLSILIERARSVVNDRYVRRLIDDEGKLPYPVSTLVFDNTKGDRRIRERRAMSARSLALLKRSYPDIYEQLISENQDEATSS